MRIFIVAGEESGDKLGASLMQGLRQLLPDSDIRFHGIGGNRMEAEGLDSLFPMDEISIMGIGEILSHYRALKARIRQTAEAVIDMQPDVLITIDLPEFSLRVARLVKAASNIRTVHYVAPTVWAWRPGRAKHMAQHIDHVLALLPFEPPYMQAAGMQCDFVGHPVVTDQQATAAEIAQFRLSHGIGEAPLALVLPGSRRSEVSRLTPVFGEVVARLAADQPEMRFVIPTAPAVAGMVRDLVSDWSVAPILIDPRDEPDLAKAEKRAAFGAADVALAASGTVSLELAAAGAPMVIAYDMSWLSRQIIGRMLLTDSVTLVSLVSETRVIPEFIGANCKPDLIADAVGNVLSHPGAQNQAMQVTMDRLGKSGPPPGERAARAVLEGIAAAAGRLH